jgi:hypothetical protein
MILKAKGCATKQLLDFKMGIVAPVKFFLKPNRPKKKNK